MIVNCYGAVHHKIFGCQKKTNQNTKINNDISFGNLRFINSNFSKLQQKNIKAIIWQKIGRCSEKISNSISNAIEYLLLRGHFDKEDFEWIERHWQKFKKTPEGIQRRNITKEELEEKIKETYSRACKELDIPENHKPKFTINTRKSLAIGGYSRISHSIEFNPYFYETGVIDIEDTIMHEVTHAREALLRAGVQNQEQIDKIISNQLINLIKTGGENRKVTTGFLTFSESPKMPQEMRDEFAEFAQEHLHKKPSKVLLFLNDERKSFRRKILSLLDNKYLLIPRLLMKLRFEIDDFFDYLLPLKPPKHLQPIKDKLMSMVKKYPEFTQQYGNEKEAYVALLDYSVSHIERFKDCSRTNLKSGILFPQKIIVDEAKGSRQIKAEESLSDSVEVRDGNMLIGKERNFFSDLYYYFSKEEVKAETNGQNFLIKNLVQEYYEKKANDTLTQDREKYIKLAIQRAMLNIKRLEKGREYLQLYKQFRNDNQYNEKLEACIREYQGIIIQIKELSDKINEL